MTYRPHCVISLRFRDGVVQRGCPHCWKVLGRHGEADAELAQRQVKSTWAAHSQLCPIPVRSYDAASTPVQTAPGAAPSAAVRARRARVARSR